MLHDLIIKNGIVFTNNIFSKLNIGILNNRVVSIYDHNNYTANNYIDAKDCYVLPGFIDVHFHVRSPSYPERGTVESETMAAAAGGITSIFEMPISNPCCSTIKIFNDRKKHFKGKSYVNYGLYAAPGTKYEKTGSNYDKVLEEDIDKINSFKEAGAIGFKIFMINPPSGREKEFNGLSIVDEGHLFYTLKLIKNTNLVTTIHAENDSLLKYFSNSLTENDKKNPLVHNKLRPSILESYATNSILYLNQYINTKIHIAHLSSEDSLKTIINYKKLGIDVTVETCPHYLFYNQNVLKKYGNFAKINPPIRMNSDKKALWDGIYNKDIDILASDHAGFCYDEKVNEEEIEKAPPGHPGVNSMIYTLMDKIDNKKFKLDNLIKLCSINPAKRFGIFPNKGSINLNNNADITIINLNKTHKYSLQNQFSKAKDSDVLYTNKKYTGKIEYTIVNGDIIYNGNTINVNNKPGKFLSPNN